MKGLQSMSLFSMSRMSPQYIQVFLRIDSKHLHAIRDCLYWHTFWGCAVFSPSSKFKHVQTKQPRHGRFKFFILSFSYTLYMSMLYISLPFSTCDVSNPIPKLSFCTFLCLCLGCFCTIHSVPPNRSWNQAKSPVKENFSRASSGTLPASDSSARGW